MAINPGRNLFFFILSLIVYFFLNQEARAQHSGKDLCVQNFNAYGPLYASAVETRSSAFTTFLADPSQRCDILHLQEVWNESQTEIVEKILKDIFTVSAPNKRSKIGLMSFFDGKIIESLTYSFRINNEGGVLDSIRDLFNVTKAFHIAKVEVPKFEEEIYFVNTHLHPTSTAVRITQILNILNWRLKNQNHKMILTGDFNADIGSIERQLILLSLGSEDAMENYFLGEYPENFCTYCKENPLGWTSSSFTFDYIFFSNISSSFSRLEVTHGEVNMQGELEKPWSDHYGVRVFFQLSSNPREIQKSQIEERRDRAIKTFETSAHFLAQQNDDQFQVYVEELNSMASQLRLRRGAFFNYFNSFR